MTCFKLSLTWIKLLDNITFTKNDKIKKNIVKRARNCNLEQLWPITDKWSNNQGNISAFHFYVHEFIQGRFRVTHHLTKQMFVPRSNKSGPSVHSAFGRGQETRVSLMNISLPFELSGIEILATFSGLKESSNRD